MRTVLMVIFMFLALPCYGDVKKTQAYLNDLGYQTGPIDGLWGGKTEQAVIQFLLDKEKIWDGSFDEKELKFIEKVWSSQNFESLLSVNRTTSRYLRAKNNCIAAENIDKTYINAFDKQLSDHLFAFANLDQDNKLDLIQGFEEEPYDIANIREPVNYQVFMSNGDKFAPNLPNLVARKILVQDFNADGKDDVVFLNAGPHKPPRPGLTNRILISGISGYTFKELPGGSRISHGGAAGDLDGDGDVDIIVANGQQQNVQILINLGNGKFKSNTLYSRFEAHPYTAEVWDVDKDGLLDIIFGVPSKGIYIAYGKTSKKNNPKFLKPRKYSFEALKSRLPLDFAFSFGNSSDDLNLVVMDTRLGPNSYRGWGINNVVIKQDRTAQINSIYDFDPGKNYHWNAWIDICDLDKDGKSELVSNRIGRNNMWALNNPQQIVWKFEDTWVQKTYARGKTIKHKKSLKPQLNVQATKSFSELSNEVLCSKALNGDNWARKTNHFQEAQARGLNIKQCKFYKARLLPKKPDGTVPSKEVCENAIYGDGWNTSQPQWVSEAKSRNYTIELCNHFTSN